MDLLGPINTVARNLAVFSRKAWAQVKDGSVDVSGAARDTWQWLGKVSTIVSDSASVALGSIRSRGR